MKKEIETNQDDLEKLAKGFIQISKSYCEDKSKFFEGLSHWLFTSRFLLDTPEIDETPFPPEKDDVDIFINWFREGFKDLEPKELDVIVDDGEPLEEQLREQYSEDLFEFLENGVNLLTSLDLKDIDAINSLMEFCLYMADTYKYFAQNRSLRFKANLFNIENLGDLLISRAYRFIGVWTIKMEEKRKNIKASSVMVKRKKENIEKVKKIMETWGKGRIAIIKAMEQTDRGERTVKEYMKQLGQKTK